MDIPTQQLVCPFCSSLIYPTDNFCPHCGKEVKGGVASLSLGRQLYIYGVSLLLPPFGLVWTLKHFRSANPQLKRVGIIAGIITIIAFGVSMWWFVGFWSGLQQQISTYSNLGY